MYPFSEKIISKNVRLRTFDSNVLTEDLAWHRDIADRTVTIVESRGWYLQFDGELPVELIAGVTYKIPRRSWHRVIRRQDSGKLVIEIVE